MKKALTTIMIALAGMLWAIGDETSAPKDKDAEISPMELAKRADANYKAKKYQEAITLYERALETSPSAELWYNLGNARYRVGEPGKAILAYERALRLNPTMREARANLEFVNTRIVDRPGRRGSFLERKCDKIAGSLSSGSWAVWALLMFVLAAGGVVVYVTGSSIMLRKTGFFGSGVLLLLCFGILFLSFRARAIATDSKTAIVTARSTVLSTVPHRPTQPGEEAMLLHEGTNVEVIDVVRSSEDTTSRGGYWYDVRIDNTHRAWINAEDVTKVYPF